MCDGFQYSKKSLTQNYFLTHFHADHYGGITKQWDKGIIYCSLPTANLVHQQIGVDRKYLHPLPINSTVVLPTGTGKEVQVTLLDANHCPGAIMFFFQIGQRRILHVGDFRWSREKILQSPIAKSLLTTKNNRYPSQCSSRCQGSAGCQVGTTPPLDGVRSLHNWKRENLSVGCGTIGNESVRGLSAVSYSQSTRMAPSETRLAHNTT